MSKEEKEPKIIIDENWKQQAQKEKEELSKKQQEEKLRAAADEKNKAKQQKLPPADFSGLISMLGTQAFFAMGFLRSESGENPPKDLKLAQYNIDLLEILQNKTKGNLSGDEQQMLEGTLHQLRMAFVKASE